MQCSVCGSTESNNKYRVFAVNDHPFKQVTVCTRCLMRAMKAGTNGAVITAEDVMPGPILAFPYNSAKKEYGEIAASEGWLITLDGKPEEATVITEHYEKALIQCYFMPGERGPWFKDVLITQEECFRRSCHNIMRYYYAWLKRG